VGPLKFGSGPQFIKGDLFYKKEPGGFYRENIGGKYTCSQGI